MELLDIRNEQGECIGIAKERKLVHRDGDLHGTSHVFIIRNRNGVWELLLQKRADNKDSFPGCYDISSAGHIPSGQDYLESALRELEEELGIKASADDLTDIGIHRGYSEEIFYGEAFKNNEISHVYLYQKHINENDLYLQEEEISAVKWFSIEECIQAVRRKDPRFCLFEDELMMIKDSGLPCMET